MNKISDCKTTQCVAALLASKVSEMPDYEGCDVDYYGPFGVSAESSVFVKMNNEIIGSIMIHYDADSESGFSYGKSNDSDTRNITVERPLPDDIEQSVDCIFERKRRENVLAPVISKLSDSECVKYHNQLTNVYTHIVFSMAKLEEVKEALGPKTPTISKSFDANAPYFVIDATNPDMPYYDYKYELRSVQHYDEIYDSPYIKEEYRLSPRTVLLSNIVYNGYADELENYKENV